MKSIIYWPLLTESARASEELLINRTKQVQADVCFWLIRCSWILISPCTSCLIVIGSAYMNERKLFGWFHVVIATSFASTAWMNFLGEGWITGRRVCTRMCFSMCMGMGVALFVAVTQVHRGFPRCYFLLTFVFVLVSHHMLWLVLPFEGVGPQHNSISPHKACQSLFSFQAWGFCSSEWVSMSPCFHFRLFMSMPRSLVYPQGGQTMV